MRTKQDGVTSQKTVISRRNSRESLTSTVTLLVFVTVYIPATSCVRITTLPTAEAIWRQVTGRRRDRYCALVCLESTRTLGCRRAGLVGRGLNQEPPLTSRP
jgi:hypothetical protein